MAEEGAEKKEAENKRHTYALVRQSDMPEEMRVETMELCVTACEKYATNNELASKMNVVEWAVQLAAKMVKEAMDKKFGAAWHVVVGEGYGFEVTHETKNILYMFFGGNVAIIVWKCC